MTIALLWTFANSCSPFGAAPPQYDQFGRRKYTNSPAYGTRTDAPASGVEQPPQGMYGSADPGYPPQAREPTYGRERQPVAPPIADRERDANRRRRLH